MHLATLPFLTWALFTKLSLGAACKNRSASPSSSCSACTSTVTATSTATTSLPAATSTLSTTITITAPGVTNTIGVTTTSVTTSTAIYVTTTTSTTTSTTYTSTVPAPSGFIPVQSSLPGSSYSGSGGVDPLSKRDSQHAARSFHEVFEIQQSGNAGSVSKRDGTSSNMTSLIEMARKASPQRRDASCACDTTTTTTTSTQTLAPTTTVTTTLTLTSTMIPSTTGMITTTSTAISTAVTTSTSTSTTTVTVFSPAASPFYAACASNNLADTYDGTIIGNLGLNGAFNAYSLPANSAYDCCVQTLKITGAISFAYLSGICYYAETVGATCTNGQSGATSIAGTGDSGLGQVTVGNNFCGEVNQVCSNCF